MPPLLRPVAVDEQLAEGSVAEDCPIRRQALRQNLATVRDEQQAGILQARPELTIVERGHEGFACTGGCDDEVSVSVMSLALSVEALEHLALERPRLEVEMEDLRCLREDGRPHSAIKPVRVARGIVRLVVGIGPVALERRLELLDETGRRCLGQSYVPLDSVEHGTVGQIR